jgi:hypothetical protein
MPFWIDIEFTNILGQFKQNKNCIFIQVYHVDLQELKCIDYFHVPLKGWTMIGCLL